MCFWIEFCAGTHERISVAAVMLCGDSIDLEDALSGGKRTLGATESVAPSEVVSSRSLKFQHRSDLFVSTGAWIVLTADIDVLDDLAVALVSVVVETET